jgi:hypothetical protein
LHVAKKAALATARKARRRAKAEEVRRAHGGLLAGPLPAAAARAPLSERERETVRRLSDEHHPQAVIAAAVNVSQGAVSKVLAQQRAAQAAAEEGGASHVAAARGRRQLPKGGRPRKVTAEMHLAVRATFRADPFGGMTAVRSALWKLGFELSDSTLRRELARCELPDEKPIIKRVSNRYAHFTHQLMDMHIGWQAKRSSTSTRRSSPRPRRPRRRRYGTWPRTLPPACRRLRCRRRLRARRKRRKRIVVCSQK